jgi:Zn-dependent protease
MIFSALDQMRSSPFEGLVTLLSFSFALLVAITFHEASHALSASLQGDPTARRLGRLTLSPLAHLDPLGTVMILFAGFGWGKPVPVNPAFLRAGERSGMAVVSMAGPISNVVVALLVAIPINTGMVGTGYLWLSSFRGQPADVFAYVLGTVIFWNLLLAAFNLIPIAPLDGFKVALGLLPREAARRFARLERYGPAILLSVIVLDLYLLRWGILAHMIRPIISVLGILVFR